MNNPKIAKRDVLLVYLADDNIEDQEIFIDAISEIDSLVELKVFDNALEIISDLQSSSQYPDIIFLDLYMPKMDGEECLKKIRSDEALGNIPIIIYSNEFDLDRVEKLFSLGANRYLRKPDTYNSLVASLERTINSVKRNNLGGTAVINIIV